MARHTFRANAFDDLRAAAGTGQAGQPLQVPLSKVDEDPHQPRVAFDPEELAALAESIKLVGVLQPVGVRSGEGGRYGLVFGARRLRAAALAGLREIPAVLVGPEQAGLAAQVIENQSRVALSNSELASVVERLHADGRTLREIAAICSMPEYQVSNFRSVPKLPPFLRERLDRADIRATYDLYRAWQKRPAEVEAAMPEGDAHLSITEARRIVEGVTGRPTGSIAIERSRHSPTAKSEPEGDAPTPTLKVKPRAAASVSAVVVETADGRRGHLALHRLPKQKAHAVVSFPEEEIEISCGALTLVSIS